MSWLLEGATTRDELLGMHAGLAAGHQQILDTLWDSSVDARILELCRLRAATLLGNTHAWDEPRSAAALAAGLDEDVVQALAQWPTDDRFDAMTRTCLALTEQYLIDVHGITDEQVGEVAAAIGSDGVITLTTALATWEISHRFDNALLSDTTSGTTAAQTTGAP